MGTDRYDEFSCPCTCGKGAFVVEHCEKDHPWRTATPVWHTARIDCPDCRTVYEIEQRGAPFVLVRLVDVQAHAMLREEARQARERLMAQPEVVAVLNELAEYLDKLPSMAETYRVLIAQRWYYSSLGTFRKGWSGGASWVRSSMRPDYLLQASHLTGLSTEAIEPLLAEYEAIHQRASVEPPAVGSPIYTVSQDG